MADFDPVSYIMGAKAGSGGGGGSSTLSGLTDVDISNPANGQTLVYNATSGKWENGEGGSGSGLVYVNVLVTSENSETTATIDKTFAELKAAYEGGAVILSRVSTEDNDNSVYGNSLGPLTYYPAAGQIPETFAIETSFLMVESSVYGCYVLVDIKAEETTAAIHTAELAVAH